MNIKKHQSGRKSESVITTKKSFNEYDCQCDKVEMHTKLPDETFNSLKPVGAGKNHTKKAPSQE